jgi:hypothetical protein
MLRRLSACHWTASGERCTLCEGPRLMTQHATMRYEEGMMAFSYTNKKGRTYFLHEQTVSLRGNNRQQTIYFFAPEVKPQGGLEQVPEGWEVKETERTGLPVLTKKK